MIFFREKIGTNGTSNAKEYVDKSMAAIIYGSNLMSQLSRENQPLIAVFCLDWNHCFSSNILTIMMSIDS